MKIFVDGDGCPVIEEVLRISKMFSMETIIVKDYNHNINIDNSKTTVITVEQGSDSADFYIVNSISKGDLLITNDIGLASMVLSKGILILNFNGMQIDERNIDYLLFSRHIGKINRNNKIYISKLKKRSKENNLNLENNLIEILKKEDK